MAHKTSDPQKTPFRSILVANRGEIACRVMRTAQSMGIKTIAIYSDADADTPHVKMADDAILIGAPPVGESYLDADKILKAAEKTGAEAIHPGYGFLSENARFAQSCAAAGIIFIGPNIEAIDIMGDKAKSKRRMIEAGVPCIPGYQGEDQSTDTLLREGQTVGVPLMVKAAAGGGGRGMRLVHDLGELEAALNTARSEAENAFGSGDLILERAILEPRHVEIQVFSDKFGHTIHLGERDCSVQRRHQKVLEEAPCPVMTQELRVKMGAAAVKAAQDINYIGAGTVEFLLDKNGDFYFLEMNTRLQVEHPVTEMVTGLDLVALQIEIARGEPLKVLQDDVSLTGHAIEARLYAEDPTQGFLPATGPIDLWRPGDGPGIRIDAGIETGGEVSPFYDPMVAKVIAYGSSRTAARLKLIEALKDTALFGVKTNKAFLIDALEREAFANGGATTAFIDENFTQSELSKADLTEEGAILGAVLLFLKARRDAHAQSTGVPAELLNWSSATPITTPYRFATAPLPTGSEDPQDTSEIVLGITPLSATGYTVAIIPADSAEERAVRVDILEENNSTVLLTLDRARHRVIYNIPVTDFPGQTVQFTTNGKDFTLTNLNGVLISQTDAGGAGAIRAPMHGQLLEVFVTEGASVTKGDRLAVLEAMKMQHELLAEVDGTVKAVYFDAGGQVAADALLLEIQTDGDT